MTRRSLSRGEWLVAGSLTAAFLAPLLLFPLGGDQSVYFIGGEKILLGAAHYRDIVDVKPPLIYHLYAASLALFGDSEHSVRILDFLLQYATCLMIVRLIRRASDNDLWAAGAAIIYAIVYVAQSPAGTSITESYTGLLAIPMIDLLLHGRKPRDYFLIGLAAGALLLLKFSLGALIVLPFVVDLLVHRERMFQAVRRMLPAVAGFAAAAMLLPLYLIAVDGWRDFLLMQEFLVGYVGIGHHSAGIRLSSAVKEISSYFGYEYSIVLTVATAADALRSLRGLPAPTHDDRKTIALLRMATVAFALLFLTVLMEGKYQGTHFTRLLPFGVVLGSYSVPRLVHVLGNLDRRDRYTWLVGTLSLCAMLAFSPFGRYCRHSISAVALSARTIPADPLGIAPDDFRPQARIIGETIARGRGPGERLFVMSSVAGLVYYEASYVPEFKIFHSAFLIAPFAPQEWKDSTRSFLLRTRPRFIVIHRHDSLPDLTGSPLSAEEALRALPGIDSMLRREYIVTTHTHRFDLYKRRRGIGGPDDR